MGFVVTCMGLTDRYHVLLDDQRDTEMVETSNSLPGLTESQRENEPLVKTTIVAGGKLNGTHLLGGKGLGED